MRAGTQEHPETLPHCVPFSLGWHRAAPSTQDASGCSCLRPSAAPHRLLSHLSSRLLTCPRSPPGQEAVWWEKPCPLHAHDSRHRVRKTSLLSEEGTRGRKPVGGHPWGRSQGCVPPAHPEECVNPVAPRCPLLTPSPPLRLRGLQCEFQVGANPAPCLQAPCGGQASG